MKQISEYMHSYNVPKSNPTLAYFEKKRLKRLYRIIPLIIGVGVAIIVNWYIILKCPKCKKAWGLKRTVISENRSSGKFIGFLGFLWDYWDLYRCKGYGYEKPTSYTYGAVIDTVDKEA